MTVPVAGANKKVRWTADGKGTVRVAITMPVEVYDNLCKLAEEGNKSVARIVNEVLDRELAESA